MQAGKLRHRITFQRLERVRDEDGDYIDEQWVDAFTVWGSFEPLSVKDTITARTTNSETVARVVVRHRSDIDTTMRLLHKGAVYEIDGDPLPDPKSGTEYLTIMVKHGVNHDGR